MFLIVPFRGTVVSELPNLSQIMARREGNGRYIVHWGKMEEIWEHPHGV